MNPRSLAALIATATLGLTGCASQGTTDPTQEPLSSQTGASADKPNVVIVSGLLAFSPYTTPTEACQTGFAAGNTDTFMREQLLAAGFNVYTSPAMVGGGKVEDQSGEAGPFGDCPPQLPADVTVDPTISPTELAPALARFLRYLKDEEGVTEVNLVGHSMGGVFIRAAMAELKRTGDGPRIVTLSTVGSPWRPAMIGDFAANQKPAAACDGNKMCVLFQKAALASPTVTKEMLPFVQDPRFDNWTKQQAGVLEGIPVTLVGGTYFRKKDGSPRRWPNDAVVSIDQALAKGVPDSVLPHRTCVSLPDTHSLWLSTILKEPEETALTWDPRTTDALIAAIRAGSSALTTENRVGCPPGQ